MKFIDQNGNIHDKVTIDGYVIAERILEGVMIDATFDDEGNATPSFRAEDQDYLDDLNQKKFLKSAKAYFEDCLSEGDFEMLDLPGDAYVESVTLDDGTPFDPNPAPVQSGFTVALSGLPSFK